MPASTKSTTSSTSTPLDATWPVYRYTRHASLTGVKYLYYYIPSTLNDPEAWRISFVKSRSSEQPIKVEMLVLDEKDRPMKEEIHFCFNIHEEKRGKLISTIKRLQDLWHGNGRLKGCRKPKTTQEMHLQFLELLKRKNILSKGAPYNDVKNWFKNDYHDEVGLAKSPTQSKKASKARHRDRIVNSIKRMGWGKKEITLSGPRTAT